MKGDVPIAVTAVFDIGKTNKKFFLFDEHYTVVKQQQTTLNQIRDEDGDPCEDLKVLEHWIESNMRATLQDKSVSVRSLNFSTYGASLVHLDEQGKAVTPLYNYLKPYPEDLLRTFYENYGGRKCFSLQTASPPMGMLNSGLQLFWLKYKKPQIYQKIDCSLHFPQYLSYIFTEKRRAELTSIGCHTGLWNFKEKEYHPWLKQEGCLRLLPAACAVTTTNAAYGQNQYYQVGVGIHDSSAALAPYLLALDDPFMLVSTGTWSISFNPFNSDPLTYQELQKDSLCYLDIHGKQVKASRFFLGNEYMYQKQKISDYFNVRELEDDMEPDVGLLNELLKQQEPSRKLKLARAYSSGPFRQDKPEHWRIDKFHSAKEAYHQLMLDLVAIQAESIKLAQGSQEVQELIVTGGFSQNNFFVKLLASFFPGKEVYTSSLTDASAYGAAMVIHEINTTPGGRIALKKLLGLKRHHPENRLNVKEYTWKKAAVR